MIRPFWGSMASESETRGPLSQTVTPIFVSVIIPPCLLCNSTHARFGKYRLHMDFGNAIELTTANTTSGLYGVFVSMCGVISYDFQRFRRIC